MGDMARFKNTIKQDAFKLLLKLMKPPLSPTIEFEGLLWYSRFRLIYGTNGPLWPLCSTPTIQIEDDDITFLIAKSFI